VAAEIDAGERMGLIRMAAPLSAESAIEILKNSITVEYTVRWKDPVKELIPRSIVTRRAGAIVISEERTRSSKKEAVPALADLLKERGIDLLPWDEDGGSPRRLLERIRFFASRRRAGTWTDEALIAELAQWLGPYIWDGAAEGGGASVESRRMLSAKGLETAMAARLGWEQKQTLDRLAPDKFLPPAHPGTITTPKPPRPGRPIHISYAAGEPVIRIRLQDCFGITGPCEVLGVPMVFHLLSPADRPIQVTRDLPGFWKGSYAEVRKEMRGRYPKHYWPEM
jgi:ATP-dependent helicase HrpB